MGAGQRCDGSDDVAHVGKLRKGLCRQERADLEVPDAGGIFLAEPALFRRRRGKGLYELEAVAQADFAQAHAAFGIDVLYSAHARFLSALGLSLVASSVRIAAVSAPSGGTFKPSPILAPFHRTGSAGTRKTAPSALKLLTSPPGRNTCGSPNRSSGRLIGEKQMLRRSSFSESSATFQHRITSATRGMMRERARMRSVVVP